MKNENKDKDKEDQDVQVENDELGVIVTEKKTKVDFIHGTCDYAIQLN